MATAQTVWTNHKYDAINADSPNTLIYQLQFFQYVTLDYVREWLYICNRLDLGRARSNPISRWYPSSHRNCLRKTVKTKLIIASDLPKIWTGCIRNTSQTWTKSPHPPLCGGPRNSRLAWLTKDGGALRQCFQTDGPRTTAGPLLRSCRSAFTLQMFLTSYFLFSL
jgi:hypothetical protein